MIKSGNKLLILLSSIILITVSGCAHYRAKSLDRLNLVQAKDIKKQHIALDCKVFDSRDCNRYLGRNVLDKGYQPIQIQFTNNSNRSFSFSIDDLSFSCESHEIVANSVHTNTTGRAVGYGVAGLFLWPLIIPAIVDGVGSAESNKKLDSDFSHKMLHSKIVKPFSCANGMVFANLYSFDPNFTLTVTDISNQEQFVLRPANRLFV